MNPTQSSSLPPDYITPNEYFMGIAYLASKRSQDPIMRVGACVVNEENNIVGIGYNSMPNGCQNLPWESDQKKFYVCHAEMNAILNKNSADVKNCTIYVTLYPCSECAKLIIQTGIKTVIYSSDAKFDFKKTRASKVLLREAGITVREFKHDNISNLEIDLHGDPSTKKFTDVMESATSGKRKRDEDGNGSFTN